MDSCDYINVISSKNDETLAINWKNDIIFDEKNEQIWIDNIVNSFPFEIHGFSELKQNEIENLLSNKNNWIYNSTHLNQNIFNQSWFNTFATKIIRHFYKIKLQSFVIKLGENITKFVTEKETIYWNSLLNSNNIDTSTFIKKCLQYQIPPTSLIKYYLFGKRLFTIDLSFHSNIFMQKAIEKELKGQTNKNEDRIKVVKPGIRKKVMNQFLIDICSIKRKCELEFMNKNDIKTVQMMNQVNSKWINILKQIYRKKLMHYHIKKLSHNIHKQKAFEILKDFEFDAGLNGFDTDLLQYKFNKLVSMELLDNIGDICLQDSLHGQTVMQFQNTSSRHFERRIFNFFKNLIQKYDTNNNILTEKDLKKLYQLNANDGDVLVTPDIKFDKPIIINKMLIHWIDVKYYYVSCSDDIGFKSVRHSVKKYCQNIGSGAILCCGYNKNMYHKICEYYSELNLQDQFIFLDGTHFI